MATQTKPRARSNNDRLVNGTKSAASEIVTVAQKAKGPALAGGAALAGLAGGLVIAGRSGPKRILGVPVPGTRRSLIKIKSPRRRTAGRQLIKAASEFGELAG